MKSVRAALLCSLSLLWLNFLLTSRWAHVDGSINGPKRPFFVAALLAASVFASWALRRPGDSGMSRRTARGLATAGLIFLGYCFAAWFPFGTWRQIPFLDDWPIRYQSAYDMMRLLSACLQMC